MWCIQRSGRSKNRRKMLAKALVGLGASIIGVISFQNCSDINLRQKNQLQTNAPGEQQKSCQMCEVINVPTNPWQRPEDIGTLRGFFSAYYMNNPQMLPDNMATYTQLYMARDKVTSFKLPKKTFKDGGVNTTLYNSDTAILLMVSSRPQDPLELIQSVLEDSLNANREAAIDATNCIFLGLDAYSSFLNSRYCTNYQKVITEKPNDDYFYLNVRPVFITEVKNLKNYKLESAINAPPERRCERTHPKTGEKVCIVGLVW